MHNQFSLLTIIISSSSFVSAIVRTWNDLYLSVHCASFIIHILFIHLWNTLDFIFHTNFTHTFFQVENGCCCGYHGRSVMHWIIISTSFNNEKGLDAFHLYAYYYWSSFSKSFDAIDFTYILLLLWNIWKLHEHWTTMQWTLCTMRHTVWYARWLSLIFYNKERTHTHTTESSEYYFINIMNGHRSVEWNLFNNNC